MSVLLVVAIVSLLIGAGLLYWRSRTLRTLGLMARVETSSAREAAAKPPGTLVEVKGITRCEAPLQSEYARMPCVHYSAIQTERYVIHDTDSQGRSQRREETRTLYSNSRSTRFLVEDASGTVRIDPEGAELEAGEVFKETQALGGLSGAIAIGAVTIGGSAPVDQTWRENAIGIDVPVYVLGVVRPGGVIGAPQAGQKDATFVVSTKSEEQRSADKAGEARWLMIFAILCFVIAAACLILPRVLGGR